MGWYRKLNQYFPEEEMKKKAQLQDLLTKNPHYQKIEEEDFILLYGEYDRFIFVDYVLVDQKARGKGIGSTILDQLKEKQKVIVLEVEPVDPQDPDTIKREKFYLANDFHRAENIRYYRDIGEDTPELNEMEVYYWSPAELEDEEAIRQYMITVYKDIHHFNYEEYFDRDIPNPEELVLLEEDVREHTDDMEHALIEESRG